MHKKLERKSKKLSKMLIHTTELAKEVYYLSDDFFNAILDDEGLKKDNINLALNNLIAFDRILYDIRALSKKVDNINFDFCYKNKKRKPRIKKQKNKILKLAHNIPEQEEIDAWVPANENIRDIFNK